MFDIDSINLLNFKAFYGRHKFIFPQEPGLYFLTGDNQKQPRLESNGAGKSTLLDAIYWCLFGETLRGMHGPDIITWGCSTASVSVVLAVGIELYTVARVQSPNSLRLNGQLVDNATVVKTIGLNRESFIRSVITPQYNEPFLDLTPTGKLDLFSNILDLSSWLELSANAKQLASNLEFDITKRNQQADALALALEAAQTEIIGLTSRAVAFKDDQKLKINAIKAELTRLEQVVDEIEQEKYLTGAELTKVKEAVSFKQGLLEQIKKDISNCAEELNHGQGAYHKASAEMNVAKKTGENLTVVGASCPTCLQVVSPKHLKTEIKAAADRLKKATVAFNEAEAIFNKQFAQLKEFQAEKHEVEKEIEGLRRDERKVSQQIDWFNLEIKENAARQESAARSIEEAAKQANPYAAQLDEKRSAILVYKAKQKSAEELLEDLTARLEATSYWVQGFKRIRLMVIEETLTALAIEVNNCLAQLGLNGWSIEFDVERENKSGGLTKGFVALVKAPGAAEAVKWAAWSGGEAQRLQLAGDLGLANLIMRQAGLVNTIEFYDEPSKHLSKAGLMDLAETLHQRAIDDGKRVFLVDHNMPEFGEFVDTIKITKDPDGNSSFD